MIPPRIEETESIRPPRFWWIVILAVSWFFAGFLGPLYFVPDANTGPLVGIFISGPAGLVVGLVLFLVFWQLPLRAWVQWVLLGSLSVAGVVTTLIFTQPEPKTVGTILEVEVKSVRRVSQAAPEILADWRKSVAQVTWSTPRAGWEQSMAAALAADSSEVLDVVLLRERLVKVTRKPWDHGRIFSDPWYQRNVSISYHPAVGALPSNLTPGTKLTLYLPGLVGDLRPSPTWPPEENFLPYASVRAVPANFEQFK